MFQPAELSHRTRVHALIRDCFAPYIDRIGRPPAPMTTDYSASLARGDVFCLMASPDASGQSVLCAVLIVENQTDALLVDTVAVAHSHRGQGLATQMINLAEDIARQRGFQRLRLYTNVAMTEALGMYLHLGFHETGRATEFGLNRVYLERSLS